MWPTTELVQCLVYSENGRSVDTVLVGGEVLLGWGRSLRIDEDALGRQACDLDERIQHARRRWASRKGAPEVAERLHVTEEEYLEAHALSESNQ